MGNPHPHPPLACRGPAQKNEKEVLSRAQSRLNEKEKASSERRAWTWRWTAANVHGFRSLLLLPLHRKTMWTGCHSAGRTLHQSPAPACKETFRTSRFSLAPSFPFLGSSSIQPWASTNQGAGDLGDTGGSSQGMIWVRIILRASQDEPSTSTWALPCKCPA